MVVGKTEVLGADAGTASGKGRHTPGNEKVGMKKRSFPMENLIFLKESNANLFML